MRIISKEFDYYDSLQNYKSDLIYIRHDRPGNIFQLPIPIDKNAAYWGRRYCNDNVTFIYRIIGFCGKIYPHISVREYSVRKDFSASFYTFEELEEWVKNTYVTWHDMAGLPELGRYRNKPTKTQKTIRDWFSLFQSEQSNFLEHFLQERSPIFVYHMHYFDSNYDKLNWDVNLGTYGFQHVFGPYQAFQEISMFMGNMTSPEKPIPAISDDIMRDAKGFDEFSFRKSKKGK